MSKEIIKDATKVEEISTEEMNNLLSIDGDIAMLPDEVKKPNVFSQVNPDTAFLDKPLEKEPENIPPTGATAEEIAAAPVEAEAATAAALAAGEEPPAVVIPAAEVDDLLAAPDEASLIAAAEEEKNKGGRPTNMIAAAKSLIEKGRLVPFDDGKKIEDYTATDFEELIEANFDANKTKLEEQLPTQFFQNMPPEMQQAYKYIADGGRDLKSLFQALGQSQEIKEIDITTEGGQAHTIRTYLRSTNYGNAEEIEEEIASLQDRGDLEKKAIQFKPKLDGMQQQMVNQRLQGQEQQNALRQKQSADYMDNVYNVLKEGKLNDLVLSERTQNTLYAGLVQPNYPSINGKQTNLLGHLLEKYQWVEPNHSLIAETLYLLSDPEGYRAEIIKSGTTAAVEATVRKLKTEQSNLHNSTQPAGKVDTSMPKRQTVARPKKNFFKRE